MCITLLGQSLVILYSVVYTKTRSNAKWYATTIFATVSCLFVTFL